MLVLATAASPSLAWDMSGTKQVSLHTRDGKDLPIGTVTFTPPDAGSPKGAKTRFAVDLDPAKFKVFFLSMRDFKCVEGEEIECVVPYPYQHPMVATPTDLSWLEHSLLFFFKKPNDYGAKLSDGLYYAMKITDQGIVGTPQAIDLNEIASPPADLSAPPYDASRRDDIPAGSRWITELWIR